MKPFDLSLYLVTDPDLTMGRPLLPIIEEAVAGGVTMVQLREKEASSRAFYELAKATKELLKGTGVPLIINDRLDIALAVDAEGLHIGQSDLPHDIARKLLGPDKILGWSVETIEQAREANQFDVDYIGLSPVFSTQTKSDISKPLELEGVREISSFTKHATVAIGGVGLQNTSEVIQAGADGIAVVSAIISHEQPKQISEQLKALVVNSKI
ncbi:thiamine phosphate synthase [Prolixibacteraceae bacterium JC049]|nr:thiamine phosphate synthase [Prolixibacteraceae bacterium JC049]